MSEENDNDGTKQSLINVNVGDIAGLSAPAKSLLEMLSGGGSALYKPLEKILDAKSDVAADKIRAKGKRDNEIMEMQHQKQMALEERTIRRLKSEQIQQQENLENIAMKADQYMNNDAKPTEIEKDKFQAMSQGARIISDEHMQEWWARLLAGEANMQGSFSKSTISLMSSIDKEDAELFEKACSFIIEEGSGYKMLFIDEASADGFYGQRGIDYRAILRLDELNLLRYGRDSFGRFFQARQNIKIKYFGREFILTFGEGKNHYKPGDCKLTKSGEELAKLCKPKKDPDFLKYVIEKLKKQGHQVTLT